MTTSNESLISHSEVLTNSSITRSSGDAQFLSSNYESDFTHKYIRNCQIEGITNGIDDDTPTLQSETIKKVLAGLSGAFLTGSLLISLGFRADAQFGGVIGGGLAGSTIISKGIKRGRRQAQESAIKELASQSSVLAELEVLRDSQNILPPTQP